MLNFYLYSISAISLSTFYFAALLALGGLLQLLFGIQEPPASHSAARETLATGLGFLAVALPLWWLHWRRVLARGGQPDALPGDGHRFYLFSVICLNAVVILFSGGLGIAGLGHLVLGVAEDLPGDLVSTGVFLGGFLLSGALWRHHWQQFRSP